MGIVIVFIALALVIGTQILNTLEMLGALDVVLLSAVGLFLTLFGAILV